MQCWESFIIADTVAFTKAAIGELKPEAVNACWKNLWRKVMNDFNGFPGINGDVRKITHTARKVGGEQLADVLDKENEEHIEMRNWKNLLSHLQKKRKKKKLKQNHQYRHY